MSESIRQNNLFSGETFQKVFEAYQFISYTAYDFNTLRQALINYIQSYYPEDFNDWVSSSQFVAMIELIAYLGTSLAFRTDLNSRENFIDTAQRRDSVIRLAQMVNYVPQRNITSSGLFKITAVETDQVLIDANGNNLNGITIYWNDPNNTDWFDQFVQICNASFSSLNPFGRPTQSGVIGSIPTDLYQLNNVLLLNVTYPTSATINGQVYPIDICNPNFITNQTIFERDPDPNNPFNFIYRNDSLGVASANTGFFLYFKQGTLLNVDTNFDFPVPSRQFPIEIQNINQSDVYVQQTDQNGNVLAKWVKVPALAGENIIYNSIQFSERNIFSVLSGANDTITVQFADGNFGNVPTGLFRFWIRTSANVDLVIRPDNVQGQTITIPYIGQDNQQYNLTVTFSLEQTIGNAAASETNDQIKLRAPEVFSTQSRMVNGSDYNVLPLIYGNQIAKLQAIDRTYSGMSRYIDLNDPTGFHRDLIIFGEDGALYRDNQNVLTEITEDSSNTTNISAILLAAIETSLQNRNVSQFFYDEYLPQFEQTIRVNPPDTGRSLLDLVPSSVDGSAPLYWKTSPVKFTNNTGYFASTLSSTAPAQALVNTLNPENIAGGIYQPWAFIKSGAVVEFAKNGTDTTTLNSVAVNNVIQSGLPLIVNPLNPYANIGPVELSENEQNNYQAVKVYPVFRNTFTPTEIINITTAIENGVSFFLYYDLLQDEWGVSTNVPSGVTNETIQPFVYPSPEVISGQEQIYSNWSISPNSGLIYINIANNNQTGITTYDITARGRVYVFESLKDVRFYWEPSQVVIDNASGLALQDTVEIMPFVNTNDTIDNNLPIITNPSTSFLSDQVSFNITGVYTQSDGFIDTSKVEVSLVDSNNDNIPDNPGAFDNIVGPLDRVVFEYYTDPLTGYQSTRPWQSRWNTILSNTSLNQLYIYFPVDPLDNTQLYSSPYIANMVLTNPTQILTPSVVTTPGFLYVYLDSADLIFINNLTQIEFDSTNDSTITLSNQISAFFNNTGIFPWMTGANNTNNLSGKSGILTNYIFNKVFLLSSISPPGYGVYYTLTATTTENLTAYPTGQIIINTLDTTHFDKNGKVFTQNTNIATANRLPLYFKWSHYSPIDQRVDPSATNIIDMLVITDSYYADIIAWKNSAGTLLTLPVKPTTEELRVQFQDLDQYKMISDNMIWNSGSFKLLFGPQADPELQASFVVVKSPTTNMSDNEIKTQVISTIDAYFDIRNWDFGETFFYTELAAFIHQQLYNIISTVVIVPTNANSQFGDLFEIVMGPTELPMSIATVSNVKIVANLTNTNLRV